MVLPSEYILFRVTVKLWKSTTMADGADNHAEAATAGPPPVHGIRLISSDSSLMDNWKLFKQKWQDYSVLVKLDEQPREYQVALLCQALGDAARRVYNGLRFNTTEEERTTREIITAFDTFAIGEVNETIERRLLLKERNLT